MRTSLNFALIASIVIGASLASGCATASPAGYPAKWWEPVDRAKAASWEVLPQDAGPGEVILSKRNELGLLSNFAPTPFTYHGKTYASLEGFWQSLLYPESSTDERATFSGLTWAFTRAQVEQMTAFDAKHAGELAKKNMIAMNIDWVTFEGAKFPYKSPTPGEHYRLILEATHAKIDQNKAVLDVLMSTGTLHLRPDHHEEVGAPPEWRYFEIYEKIRDDLKAAITAANGGSNP